MSIDEQGLKNLNTAETYFLTTAYYGQAKALSAEDELTPVSFLHKVTTALNGWFNTREAIASRLGLDENTANASMPEPITIELTQGTIRTSYERFIKPLLASGGKIADSNPDLDQEIARSDLFNGPDSLSQFFATLQDIMLDSQEQIDEAGLSSHVQDWWKTGSEMREFHQGSDKDCTKDGKTCGGVATGCPVATMRR